MKFFRKRRFEVGGAQSGLYVDERDLAVERGNRGRISRRCVALCKNAVGLNLADKMIQGYDNFACAVSLHQA